MRILLAEAHDSCRDHLAEALSRFGTVVAVSNGFEVLAAFEAADAQGLGFDLVLLDLAMAGCDGITAARALRDTYRHVPPLWGVSFDRRGLGPFDRMVRRDEVGHQVRRRAA